MGPSPLAKCLIVVLASWAFDPGLNITGYGVLEPTPAGLRLCEAGIVRGRCRGSLTARLVEIHDGIADVIAALEPAVLALEELYSHYARPRTAILMGHARGVICLAGAKAGIEVVHYPFNADQADPDRQRPSAQVADPAVDSTGTEPSQAARAGRRGRRPGDRTVSLLSTG